MVYLWEVHQDFSHLVTALAASNVNNDVGVGELGQRLTNDSLSTPESTRNADSTTLDTGEKGVQDTLADNEGPVGGQLLGSGTGNSDGPVVHHAVLGLDSIKLKLQNLLVHRVATRLCKACDGSSRAGR